MLKLPGLQPASAVLGVTAWTACQVAEAPVGTALHCVGGGTPTHCLAVETGCWTFDSGGAS